MAKIFKTFLIVTTILFSGLREATAGGQDDGGIMETDDASLPAGLHHRHAWTHAIKTDNNPEVFADGWFWEEQRQFNLLPQDAQQAADHLENFLENFQTWCNDRDQSRFSFSTFFEESGQNFKSFKTSAKDLFQGSTKNLPYVSRIIHMYTAISGDLFSFLGWDSASKPNHQDQLPVSFWIGYARRFSRLEDENTKDPTAESLLQAFFVPTTVREELILLQELTTINPQSYALTLSKKQSDLEHFEAAEKSLEYLENNLHDKFPLFKIWGDKRQYKKQPLLKRSLYLLVNQYQKQKYGAFEDFWGSLWQPWQGQQFVTPGMLTQILQLPDTLASRLAATVEPSTLQQDSLTEIVKATLGDTSKLQALPKTMAILAQRLYATWEEAKPWLLKHNRDTSSMHPPELLTFYGLMYTTYKQEDSFNSLVRNLNINDQNYDNNIARLLSALTPDFMDQAQTVINTVHDALLQQVPEGVYRYVAIAQQSGFFVLGDAWEVIPHEIRKYQTMAHHARTFLNHDPSWELFRQACAGATNLGDTAIFDSYMDAIIAYAKARPTSKRRDLLLPLGHKLLESDANATKEACLVKIFDQCIQQRRYDDPENGKHEQDQVRAQERECIEKALEVYPNNTDLKRMLIKEYSCAVIWEEDSSLIVVPDEKLLTRLEGYGRDVLEAEQENSRPSSLERVACLWLRLPDKTKGVGKFIDIQGHIFKVDPIGNSSSLMHVSNGLEQLHKLLSKESKETADAAVLKHAQRFSDIINAKLAQLGQETASDRQALHRLQESEEQLKKNLSELGLTLG